MGYNKKGIANVLEKIGAKPRVIEGFNKDIKEHHFENSAFVYSQEETGCTILWYPDWQFNWDYINTLVHETNHLVFDVLIRFKNMGAEPEAMAYQQEYLFNEIRLKMEEKQNG